ncbi:MAG: bifunctional DNA primase/polymerase, partial [Deferribacteraceae bacterium]|nr:bifunctional DNA primase/polymerase [Deferribacteraceae bacterium]
MSQVKRSSILKELLAIARKGFPIFPCKPDKKPYISGGFKSASTDPKQIKAWFQEFPDALWGMPTGKISGIMVLDVDMPEGENSLAALEAENSPLPATKEVLTQSGGRHIYFKYVAGAKCSAGQLAKNLDIRTDGGYVIIPPSAGYTVVKDVAIADAPTWLVWLIQKLKSKKSSRKSSADAHVANSILDGMCKEMAQTQEGERNDKLNALAFQLGLMVGNKELPESALDKLMEAALESGLELDEIESTSQSGFTAGVQKAATEDRIPAGFTLDENWLFYTSDKQTMRVSTPLKILARTRDESGNSWGILIEWKDLDGNLHRLVMSHAMLIDRLVWLTPLVDGGLILATHQRAVGLLHTYLTSYRTHNRAICIDRTGWHRGAFVFPDTVMYVGEVESVGNPVNTAILSLQ